MPLPRVQTSITLFGSPPWGFRISGGKEFNQPLVITRVTPGSLAARSGVQSGDVVIAINNQYVSNLSQDECEAKVRQAVGSLYLVLEKNAAKVTELPGGQYEVDGDRSVYTSTKDTQERISKYNRSAKPFGAADDDSKDEEEKSSGAKPGFRSISFKPKAATGASAETTTLPTSARGDPDGVNSTSDSLSKVSVGGNGTQSSNGSAKKFDVSSYNRKPMPFGAENESNNSNVTPLQEDDLPPPPPDFIEDLRSAPAGNTQFVAHVVTEPQKPGTVTTKKRVVMGPSAAIGLYSKANADVSYQAQVGDL